jgi:hypothetical protein
MVAPKATGEWKTGGIVMARTTPWLSASKRAWNRVVDCRLIGFVMACRRPRDPVDGWMTSGSPTRGSAQRVFGLTGRG